MSTNSEFLDNITEFFINCEMEYPQFDDDVITKEKCKKMGDKIRDRIKKEIDENACS